ncbi:hypothetical protein SAY87_010335 [Trapa incisa]|uniref:Small EDRK-rich factor-like N-terminal domain-containing protein n=1 Tax=Trapa incisa TaxID=236973 RepID=A0AAN7JIA8_9MYRT|nr:hypothetical protein SAY87_010335 [Trapa incisa]
MDGRKERLDIYRARLEQAEEKAVVVAMGGGNGQKAKMAREKNMEKQKAAARGSQLDSNKKAMTIQDVRRCEYDDVHVMWEMLNGRDDGVALIPSKRTKKPSLWNLFSWA